MLIRILKNSANFKLNKCKKSKFLNLYVERLNFSIQNTRAFSYETAQLNILSKSSFFSEKTPKFSRTSSRLLKKLQEKKIVRFLNKL